MRHLILLIVLYALAVVVSIELRSFLLLPPDSIAETKSTVIGVWSGSDGWGSFEEKLEIEFRSYFSYTLRIKPRNEGWHETSGYYMIDTVRDRFDHHIRCAVSFDNERKGDYWYFRRGNVLYSSWGSAHVAKNLNWWDRFLWYLVIPSTIVYLPARIFWKKVTHARNK